MKTRVLKPDVSDYDSVLAVAREAAQAIEAGKLVGFATETVYGIAAAAGNAKTMERLRELKSRPETPFSLHIAESKDIHRYINEIPVCAERIIKKAWPGPVTLILPTGGKFADETLPTELHDMMTHQDFLGIRCPNAVGTNEMLSMVSQPVIAPSANLKGEPSPRDASDVLTSLDGEIDILVDTGETRFGKDSTIVKIDGDKKWQVLRAGVISRDEIQDIMTETYLFVCTGNTCRSPMAEGIAKKILADKHGCSVADLEQRGVRVLSAGIWANDASPATAEAVQAARQLGADIRGHSSRKLTSELINSADVVFCMSANHLWVCNELAASAADRIRLIDEHKDIPDPVGCNYDVYLQTARRIEKLLKDFWKSLLNGNLINCKRTKK